MAERHPHWARLAEVISARPAVQRATAREQQALAEARAGRFHGRQLIEPPRAG